MFSPQANAQDTEEIADKKIVRLKPAVFSQLPKNIISYLESLSCTVPQTYMDTRVHNVIRGQFDRNEQFDWAVLCSRNRVSSILIFWNGSTRSTAEIAAFADRGYLQAIDGGGNMGFSRAIEVVDKKYILEHYRSYGGRKPPRIEYQGINDAFVEKASKVHYFYRGRWLELQGAD